MLKISFTSKKIIRRNKIWDVYKILDNLYANLVSDVNGHNIDTPNVKGFLKR